MFAASKPAYAKDVLNTAAFRPFNGFENGIVSITRQGKRFMKELALCNHVSFMRIDFGSWRNLLEKPACTTFIEVILKKASGILEAVEAGLKKECPMDHKSE